MLEHLRGAGRGQVGGAEHVLHGDGQAGQSADRLARLAPLVDPGRGAEGALAIDLQKRIDRPVERLDPAQECLRALHGRQITLADGVHEVDGGEFGGLHGRRWRGGSGGFSGG